MEIWLNFAQIFCMIQRFQTLYLLAIILIGGMLCTGSVINMHVVDQQINRDYTMNFMYFNTYENGQLVASKTQYLLLVMLALVIGWTVKTIFDYKNRPMQMRNVKMNFVLLGLLAVSLFSTATFQIPSFNLSTLNFNSIFGLALMIYMFYANLRAYMLIKKDEDLVKSADRIR